MKNVFDLNESNEIIARIQQLSPASPSKWGKMNVGQMLAHCNVTYELAYENKHPKPNAAMKLVLRFLVKPMVVSETPYKKKERTAPAFIMTAEKEFEIEKNRLIGYIQQTQQLGKIHFEGKSSHSFGALSALEWNNMFYKHLDHHLQQFGV